MKSDELSLGGVAGASDDDVHQHHRNALSAALIDANVADVDAHSTSLDTAVSVAASAAHTSGGTRGGALFDEFYDDWAAFDAAVALAIEQHHPIRKRSSLTFEVYNRTVSKGRHDRKCIAEYLSKTFKCTHGIKFRPRGKGRRERHKLRDTGCPFHVYATVVEFGATYRVKVRQQDQHNHPIGPDALKHMSSLVDTDYDLEGEGDAAQHEHPAVAASATLSTAEIDHLDGSLTHKSMSGHHQHHHPDSSHQPHQHHSNSASGLPDPHASDESDQSHAGLDHAQTHVLLKAQAIAQAHEILQAQAHVRAHAQEHARLQAAEAQAQALLHAQAHADMLVDAAVHESESLLESAIESTISGDFGDAPKEAPAHVSPSLESEVAAATEEAVAPVVAVDDAPSLSAQEQHQDEDAALTPPPKFEPTTTLEAIRRKMAAFADERDWNQFHTPRNLVLALTGEVGELCEIFQWRGDSNSNVADWTPEDKEHLGEEMSDVLLYLVRLADQCNVDLVAAVHDKMAKNARKYPAEVVRGSAKKYNEYKRQRRSSTDASSSSNVSSALHGSSGAGETALI